jgi:arylsulfatase A-like enzyme
MKLRVHAVWIAAGGLLVALAVVAELSGWTGFVGRARHLLAILGAALCGAGGFAARGTGPLSPRSCVAVAVWLGLVAGLLEVAQRWAMWWGFGEVVRQPVGFVWMAPALHAAWCGVLGLGFAALARRGSRLASAGALACALGALLVFALLLVQSELDPRASLLLAVGVAVQLGRTAERRAAGLTRLVRRTLPWLLALVVALGALAELRPRGGAPEAAPPAGAPDVLFIVLDTLRADHLGSYGYQRPTTPRLDALAASSAVFERAFTTAPWTLASHVSMFTGLYPFETRVDWMVPLDADPPTLAEILARRGWATAGFVGNLAYCGREWGIDRGFADYSDYPVRGDVLLFATALGNHVARALALKQYNQLVRNDAAHVTREFLDWQSRIGDRPYFAFLNLFDVHGLYLTDPGYQTRFGPKHEILYRHYNGTGWKPWEIRAFVDGYDGCLAFLDACLGDLFDALAARGRLDSTLIVVVGDHGEHFGEDGGRTGHGTTLYPALLHVPLLVRWPKRIPATRLARAVSVRDLPATLLDVLGVRDASLPGHSLAPLWAQDGDGDEPECSPVFAEVHAGPLEERRGKMAGDGMRTLIEDGVQLILNGDGTEELYQIEPDPRAERNLIRGPKGQQAAQRLRARIDALRAK